MSCNPIDPVALKGSKNARQLKLKCWARLHHVGGDREKDTNGRQIFSFLFHWKLWSLGLTKHILKFSSNQVLYTSNFWRGSDKDSNKKKLSVSFRFFLMLFSYIINKKIGRGLTVMIAMISLAINSIFYTWNTF